MVRQAHPDGIDILIDLASDATGFAALATMVRPGGTALTTQYVADEAHLREAGVNGEVAIMSVTVARYCSPSYPEANR
jgi:NADPH:quinone reductase